MCRVHIKTTCLLLLKKFQKGYKKREGLDKYIYIVQVQYCKKETILCQAKPKYIKHLFPYKLSTYHLGSVFNACNIL